jgi:uncharacterized membrane protein YphA (DoxX/SURF4 family)
MSLSYVQEFFLFTAAATVVVLGLVMALRAPGARGLAYAIYVYTLVVGSAALAITLVRALGLSRLSGISGAVFRVLLFRGWLVAGVAVATVLMVGWSRMRMASGGDAARENVRAFVASPYVLRTLSVSVALTFLTIELGKWMHDAEILDYFLRSGLPGWFRHAVMGIELLCAIGLLVPRPLLTMPAAAGSIAMMAGAIGTHYRNGDPFEDSLDAFHLLVILLCMLVLGYVLGWTRGHTSLESPRSHRRDARGRPEESTRQAGRAPL